MRLKIEEWLYNQPVNNEAKSLLEEAIICYKSSAYKASMLFSYLFFQTVLKERILSARCPDCFSESHWNGTIKKLEDDDTWDKTVFECVKRSNNGVYFYLNDDIRQQVEYWKNRRNDCAHAKSNSIISSHVESFWSFLQSNLSKFAVSGSKEALYEKIKIHFDFRSTPSYADPSHIIQEIPNSILKNDYREFCSALHDLEFSGPMIYSSYYRFWIELFDLSSDFTDQMIDYLEMNLDLLEQILYHDPSKVVAFHGRNRSIRQLWHRLKQHVDPYIFFSLLRNDLIPLEEQDEAMKYFINNYQSMWPNELTDEEIRLLNRNNFFFFFKQIAFVQNKISNFEWANGKRLMVVWFLKENGLDEDIVSSLNKTFSSNNNPWHLKDAIKELLQTDTALKENYLRISESLNMEPPTSFDLQ